MDTNRESAHQSPKKDNLFPWARVLKWRRKREKQRKGDSASALSRFAPLSEGELQQILTERHPGKTKQMTNWSVSTFKGKLKFFRFKIVKYKTRVFNRKFEMKPIPILLNISFVVRFSRRIWCAIPQAMLQNNWFMLIAVHYRVMEHLKSLESTQEGRVALGYRFVHLLRFFLALQTSRVLHNSIVHAKAWTNC